jgi:prepilin-type N-terminal cleavage/methylation domain-containing protein
MIRANRATTRRAGFTLVEVLVVIAIIAVLVSLTAAAVFKISGKGDELIARHDISNLAAAIEAFKQQMKVDFIPSRFRLREDLFGYVNPLTADYLDSESWAYLKKLFPKLPTPAAAYPMPGSVLIDWNNNGTQDGAVDLEGHQCLVFFLGGIPTGAWNGQPNNVTGFSTNPAYPGPALYVPLPPQPATPVPVLMTTERIGPFYRDFKSDRLTIILSMPLNPTVSIQNGTQTGNAGFFSYLDPWGVNPYAYFSAYKKVNGYNRYLAYYASPPLSLTSNSAPGATWSDNHTLQLEARATLTTGIGDVWPYAQAAGNAQYPLMTYLNKDTYQIISSGPDRFFGEGTPLTIVKGVWTPLSVTALWTPQNTSQVTAKGRDDFSNFHDRQLGSGD